MIKKKLKNWDQKPVQLKHLAELSGEISKSTSASKLHKNILFIVYNTIQYAIYR